MTWIPWFVCSCLGFGALVLCVAWLDERRRALSLQRRLDALTAAPEPEHVLFFWGDEGEL